jgi:hypothetical protein
MLTVYPLSGLALVLQQQGDLEQARSCADEVLLQLENDGLDDTDDPFRLYLNSYIVYKACGDIRASQVLSAGRELMLDRAARIADEHLKNSFLSSMPIHADLLNQD